MITRRCIAVAAFGAMAVSAAALAEPRGLVNVDVSNVRADIARHSYVNPSLIPEHVQLPVGMAARVCGVEVGVLARQDRSTPPTCQAKNKSQALNEEVQRLLVAQK